MCRESYEFWSQLSVVLCLQGPRHQYSNMAPLSPMILTVGSAGARDYCWVFCVNLTAAAGVDIAFLLPDDTTHQLGPRKDCRGLT